MLINVSRPFLNSKIICNSVFNSMYYEFVLTVLFYYKNFLKNKTPVKYKYIKHYN